MSDISNSFDTRTQPIISFFQEPGLGFYIPLYQRDYSWDKEHIEQLMEDICQGVGTLVEKNDDTRFLGTIIVVAEQNKQRNIRPQDKEALPTRIDNIIDGQQRISTLALLAALLYQKLFDLRNTLSESGTAEELQDVFRKRLSDLQRIFAIDLERGDPPLKPIVISASAEDMWTLNGNDNLYRSDVSNYVAKVIRAIHEKHEAFPRISSVSGKRVRDNLQLMWKCIDVVESSHLPDSGSSDYEFPSAQDILTSIDEEYIWIFDRPELKQTILDTDIVNPQKSALCSLVQVSAFCHYVLNCCCFITIQPTNDEWAFDMFQSLNGTGTPLTAIETFKATVVHQLHPSYKESKEMRFFNTVDALLGHGDTSSKKATLTDDLLTTFAHAYNGKKLSRHFSKQKRWLDSQYRACLITDDGERFVERISQVATFLRHLNEFDPAESSQLSGLSAEVAEADRRLATFCLLYLKDANHKMARTILSLFYSRILDSGQNSSTDFVEATKAVAAFFTLWRSASSTSGLDDAYRKILRGDSKPAMSWDRDKQGDNLSVANLKASLRHRLKKKVGHQEQWMNSAATQLNYDNVRTVCRFALFITINNIIPDRSEGGLIREGRSAAVERNYWTPELWRDNRKLFTIEHIAPQTRGTDSEWDTKLYEEANCHKLGNLTLMPANVNASASNKNWKAKWIYYKHLDEKDPSQLEELRALAEEHEVVLQQDVLTRLRDAPINDHMASIIAVGIKGNWDYELVKRRTERMLEILWKRLYAWL